jgi:competence protein ComEA
MRTLGLSVLLALFTWSGLLSLAYAAELVNINTADAAQLDTLPGIGPTKAAAIVSYRQTHGDFSTIADIQKVTGVGPVTYAKLADFITVGGSRATSTSASMQPVASPASSPKRTTVEKVTSQRSVVPTHEQAVAAPTAASEPAAVGATLPPTGRESAPGIFSSPWTLGFVGVVVLAGGAFILL